MDMHYQPGCKVRIKSFDELRKYRSFNNETMRKWCGQTMTIRCMCGDDAAYMEEDKNETHCNTYPGWIWEFDWFDQFAPEASVNVNDLCSFI